MSVPRHSSTIAILTLFALVALAGEALSQVPESFGFSGYLETEDGPVNAQVEVEVRILMSESARSAEVTEVHRFVDVIDGQFTLEIGSIQVLDIASFGDEWVLEFVVDGDVLSPPIHPSSVPYAQVADTALNNDGVFVGDYQVVDSAGNWTGEALAGGSSLDELGCTQGEAAVVGSEDWACVSLPAEYAQIDMACPSEQVMRGLDDQGEPLCVDMPNSVGEGSDDYIGPEAIADMATKTWVHAQNYATDGDLAPLATRAYVDSAVSSSGVDLSSYATKSYVSGLGFLTSSDISGLASRSYVDGQNFVTDSDLSGYATQSYVSSQNFVTGSQLEGEGFATESYVNSATSSATEGLASERFVRDQGYLTASAAETAYAPIATTATQEWVNGQVAANGQTPVRYFQPGEDEVELAYNPRPALFHLGASDSKIDISIEIIEEYCADLNGCEIHMTGVPLDDGGVQNGAASTGVFHLVYDMDSGFWSTDQRFLWTWVNIWYDRWGRDGQVLGQPHIAEVTTAVDRGRCILADGMGVDTAPGFTLQKSQTNWDCRVMFVD